MIKKVYAALLVATVAGIPAILVALHRGKVDEKPHRISQADARAEVLAGQNVKASETYTRLGELLLTPQGVIYADQMFDLALKANPSNARALFYSAFTPLLKISEKIYPSVAATLTTTEAAELSAIRTKWIEAGAGNAAQAFFGREEAGEPLASLDLQTYLVKTAIPTIEASLAKLDRVARLGGITLTVPAENRCRPIGETKAWECDDVLPGARERTVNVDTADLKVVQVILRSVLNGAKLASAYDLGGATSVVHQIKKLQSEGKATEAAVVSLLQKNAEFGRLKNSKYLASIRDTIAQVVEDAVGLEEAKVALCDNETRRDGGFLVESICVSAKITERLSTALDLLKGESEVAVCGSGDPRVVKVDVEKLLQSPVADLKAMLPSEFDADGKAKTFKDPTFGGLFPNGDLIEALSKCGQLPALVVL